MVNTETKGIAHSPEISQPQQVKNSTLKPAGDIFMRQLPEAKKTVPTFEPCRIQLIDHRNRVAIMGNYGLWRPGEKLLFDMMHQNELRKIFQQGGYPIGPQTRIDAYNPSSEFINPPNTYMAYRVQPDQDASGVQDEFGSKTVIAKNIEGKWQLQDVVFDLEDPFVTEIDGVNYFGGVRLQRDDQGKLQHYETVIYKGKTIPELKENLWIVGPKRMKDIRMLKQQNGKIGWYTRPQGEKGGLGNIGYTEMSPEEFSTLSSEEIKSRLEEAPLLPIRFPEDEWGGVNQAQIVTDENSPYYGMNLLLVHQAMKDEKEKRHYYPKVVVHDPATGDIYDFGINAERPDFPDGPSRNGDDLQGVVFPGSLKIIDSNWAELTAGTSDKEIAERIIPNPLRFPPTKYSFSGNQQEQLVA